MAGRQPHRACAGSTRTVLPIGEWVGVFVTPGDESSQFGELAPGLFGGLAAGTLLGSLVSERADPGRWYQRWRTGFMRDDDARERIRAPRR